MFAPSGGKNHKLNNKLRLDIIYLLPHPPPLRWHSGRWRCQRPASTWAAPPRRPGRCQPATLGRDGAGGSTEEKEGR